jgi:hypothetical protein
MGAPDQTWDYPEFLDSDDGHGDVLRDIRRLPAENAVLDSTLVLSELVEGRYSISDPRTGLTFSLSWDKNVFPYLWYYRSMNALDYPYYGRSRFIALEPCTSKASGLASQTRSNDVRYLGPRESLASSVVASVRRA